MPTGMPISVQNIVGMAKQVTIRPIWNLGAKNSLLHHRNEKYWLLRQDQNKINNFDQNTHQTQYLSSW